jgi:hypothetical protein
VPSGRYGVGSAWSEPCEHRVPVTEHHSENDEWQLLVTFLDADRRRTVASEIEYGTRWTKSGRRFELVWYPGTGELCLLDRQRRRAQIRAALFSFGGDSGALNHVRVAPLGIMRTRREIDELLDGWQTAMRQPESLDWLAARLTGR